MGSNWITRSAPWNYLIAWFVPRWWLSLHRRVRYGIPNRVRYLLQNRGQSQELYTDPHD